MTYPPNNDPYANQPPQSGYGAPQTPPPGYGAPQPPAYGAPQAPGYGAPQPPVYGAPQGQPPVYGAPQGQPPAYGAPQGQPPAYGAPQAAYGGYGAPAVDYASWIQRVGAALIDFGIVFVIYLVGALLGSKIFIFFALIAIGVGIYNVLYQQGTTGQSWGKKALGIRLVSEETGQPIGIGMVFVRGLAHIVDSAICGVGYLFPLWDEKKQTLADKIMKTLVVR